MSTYRIYYYYYGFVIFSRRVPTASVGKSICFRIIAVGIRQKPESRETRALNDGTRVRSMNI